MYYFSIEERLKLLRKYIRYMTTTVNSDSLKLEKLLKIAMGYEVSIVLKPLAELLEQVCIKILRSNYIIF